MCEILSWQTKWQPQLKLVQLPLWMCLFQRETLAWVLRRHLFSRRWPFQPRLPEEPLKSWSVISVCFVIFINNVKMWIRAKTSFSKGLRTTKRVLCDIKNTLTSKQQKSHFHWILDLHPFICSFFFIIIIILFVNIDFWLFIVHNYLKFWILNCCFLYWWFYQWSLILF